VSEEAATGEREIVVYTDSDGGPQVEVIIEGETAWLTQRQMADLFGVDVRTISEHVGNVYAEGELGVGATFRESRIGRSGHLHVRTRPARRPLGGWCGPTACAA
jgi:hypothetical protein